MARPIQGAMMGRMTRALRFHAFGEPADVLRVDDAPVPELAARRIRVMVHACGLNPADWALCRGLQPGALPRGIGLDVAGVVDAIGEGVTDVTIGDRVVGGADFTRATSAGAAELALLDHWAVLPANLDFVDASALPLAAETAALHLDAIGLREGQTVLVNGAGTAVGLAAVQLALLRGARVIATAGTTHEGRLRALGAKVTRYGVGLYSRLQELGVGRIDLAFDTAPVTYDPKLASDYMQARGGRIEPGADAPLTDVVRAVGGDPHRVVTCTDLRSAVALGVRTSFDIVRPDASSPAARATILREVVRYASEGSFSIPVARTFPLDAWREALALSESWRAGGKLVLLPR